MSISKKSNVLILLFACLLLAVLIIMSLYVGVKSIDYTNFESLMVTGQQIFVISRFPRTIALILSGVGLSISGVIMQQISLNKFVSPSTAGTLDAAKLGILLGLIILPTANSIYQMGFALIFTILANLFFVQMLRRIKHRSLIYIPLLGIMFGNILSGIGTFFAYKYDIVQSMDVWLLGDFSKVLQGQYELIYISAPLVIITYLYANKLTALGLGKNMVKTLGLNYELFVLLGILCVSLTVSAIMITAGAIPFLGLIVPNIVSLVFGDNLKKSLPYTALLGAILILICDILSRTIIFPYEIPIGLTLSIFGGTFFIIFIVKRMRYA